MNPNPNEDARARDCGFRGGVYDLESYGYDLPEGCIAQSPAVPRDSSRLMVWSAAGVGGPLSGAVEHRVFSDIAEILEPGDLLVLNDTRVIPARLRGERAGGGKAEILLLGPCASDSGRWRALVRPGRRLPEGAEVRVGDRVLTVEAREADGVRIVRAGSDREDVLAFLGRCGQTPLPPYIGVSRDARLDKALRESYQTVFAEKDGSAAAPTASLHFTRELLERIEARGVEIARTTLHVGLGTFRPVSARDIREHRIHSERCEIPEEAADAVRRCRLRGGRVVAAGTTVARTLESAALDGGRAAPGARDTELFIFPGFRYRVVDALITNFHLPKSSLLMLVSAFVDHLQGGGREAEALSALRGVYALALSEGYRFFSFGDAMFIRK
ncbi:MAG: tRNA preQ1(34) S-adenosylmethionine ribosyltransferase-isomerase QueA [Synergistaceae bacterium]|nr:tRNA preQ1(34) S-adenosylmethionine ribosyltransferase-isomerase QueA [Synergistaceae bacterium]